MVNVELEFLPKNKTSRSQQLEQGIIACANQKINAKPVERSVD